MFKSINDFINAWGDLWYPWIDRSNNIDGFWVVLLFIGGSLSLWFLCSRIGKEKTWFDTIAFLMFVWALPAFIGGIVGIITAIFYLAIGLLILALVGLAFGAWGSSTPDYTAKKTGKDTWEIHKNNDESDDD